MWQPDVGLDVGFKANASIGDLRVGIMQTNVGVGKKLIIRLALEIEKNDF